MRSRFQINMPRSIQRIIGMKYLILRKRGSRIDSEYYRIDLRPADFLWLSVLLNHNITR